MHKKLTRFALVVVAVAGIAAAETLALATPDVSAQTMDELAQPRPNGEDNDGEDNDEDRGETIDDQFATVARRHPGFGGMYVDEEKDTLYVYLVDGSPATAQEIGAALGGVFGSEHLAQGSVQVLPARFSFLELKQWHDQMAVHVLGLPGVALTDIDDAKNRLLVGVGNSQARTLVEQTLVALGIPAEAVNIVETGPIERASSLTDFHRPVVGGLQISFPLGPRFAACTLGFIANRAGVLGFVTNAHCSARLGAVDGTDYHQPLVISTTSRIGVETVDPGFRRCFVSFTCRQSDSNFSRLDSPVSNGRGFGFIARPVSPLGISSTAWDSLSTFRIVAEGPTPLVGMTVTKVGRSTGRTEGTVSLTGVTLPLEGGRLLRNQVAASYVSEAGDSGAPVIRARGPAPAGNPIDASLQGITWGGASLVRGGEPASVSLFSTIGGVEADLGPLTTSPLPVAP